MTVKCTALFNLPTNVSSPNLQPHRIGGWSESWYHTGNSIPVAVNDFAATNTTSGNGVNQESFCLARADLLPVGAAIVGQRYQVVNPVGPSQSFSQIFPGSSGLLADSPQMALLCRVGALGANNTRRMILRGIPDARTIEGEYQPSQAFSISLQNFFQSLFFFQFRGRDLSQPQIKLISISATGAFQTEVAHGFNPGDMVRVLRARTADGDVIGGRFQVATIGPSNLQGTLLNWGTEATFGGSLRKDAITFVNVDTSSITIGRMITRRVGRPPGQFRGRRSRRTA